MPTSGLLKGSLDGFFNSLLSKILISYASVFLLLLFLFFPSLPVVLVLCLPLSFSVPVFCTLYGCSLSFLTMCSISLTTFLSLCILQTLAWFKSVHFLRLFLWSVVALLNSFLLMLAASFKASFSITNHHLN